MNVVCKKICLFTVMILIVVYFVGCKDDISEGEVNTKGTFEYQYDAKVDIWEDNDGWVHYFVCEYVKGAEKPVFYMYDAYNLKYKHIEGYDIEVLDENGNIIDNMQSSVPYLMLCNDYDNDFKRIDDYFKILSPIKTLTGNEEQKLTLEKLNKNIVINLYNNAVISSNLEDGKYYFLPEADIVQEDMNNGCFWQVGFFVVHGVIVSVNIELVYENNIYLTDLIKDEIADNSQLNMASKITDIEKCIIEKQSFIVSEELYDVYYDDIYGRLDMLLTQIEYGSYN